MSIGDGRWFAVTSLDRTAGTWFIVADGDDAQAVRVQACSLIAGDSAGTAEQAISAAQADLIPLLRNLLVLPRRAAFAYVGSAGYQSYVGNQGMLGPHQICNIVR